MEKKPPLIILTGSTAVGKTDLSIRLAKAIGGEIVSADSVQVYRSLNIGSAKITPEEMEGVPHHLIDVLDPEEPFHIVLFQELAKKAINEIYSRGHIPIVTGGTGFYIQGLLYDIHFQETDNDIAYRSFLESLAEEKGEQYLHDMLREVDEASANEIHANNRKRVIRALEYYHNTGEPISVHNENERKRTSPYNFAYFVLNRPREELYERINARVDLMLEAGLVDEVRSLRNKGYSRSLVSMQGLGYKELLSWLDGECTFEEAVNAVKQETRHFAKRQLTWFRRERDVTWVNMDAFSYDQEEILRFLTEYLQEHGIWSVSVDEI